MSERVFNVVQSEDGRLSLWPVTREIPWGWRAIGYTGARDDCLAHIAEIASTPAAEGGKA